jgi:hypothetical protein
MVSASSIWGMGTTFNGAWRRNFLVVKNQFINNVAAVHTTASRSSEWVTGSNQIHEIFFHQVPSASNTHHPLTDHA